MKKKIKISVGDIEQSSRRFVGTWRKVERGEPVASQEYLTFDNLDTLLRVLTPTRWTLLRLLRREGPLSVRALSKSLSRDYKNVHRDVRELESVGSENELIFPCGRRQSSTHLFQETLLWFDDLLYLSN